jgi:Zn-dependent protease
MGEGIRPKITLLVLFALVVSVMIWEWQILLDAAYIPNAWILLFCAALGFCLAMNPLSHVPTEH